MTRPILVHYVGAPCGHRAHATTKQTYAVACGQCKKTRAYRKAAGLLKLTQVKSTRKAGQPA